MEEERRRTIFPVEIASEIRSMAVEHSTVFAHACLCFVWLNVFVQGPVGLGSVCLLGTLTVPFWAAPALFCALAYFVSAAVPRALAPLEHGRRHSAVAAVLGVVGTLLMLAALSVSAPSASSTLSAEVVSEGVFLALYLTGSACVGCCNTLLLVKLADIYDRFAPRSVLFCNVMAIACAAIAVFALSFLPAMAECVILCAISVLFFSSETRAIAYSSLRPLRAVESQGQQAMPYTFMLMALCLGLSNGLTAMAFVDAGRSFTVSVSTASWLGCAVVLLCAAALVKLDFSQLVYQVGLPVAAAGALLSTVALIPRGLGLGLEMGGAYFTYFCVWGLCVLLIKYLNQTSVWTVSYSAVCLFGGQFLGFVISLAFHELLAPAAFDAFLVVFAIALFFVCLAGLEDRSFRIGWGTTLLADGVTLSQQRRDAAVSKLVAMNGLTNREREVFEILAQGRGRQFVQKELFISDNTAKAHIRSIYRKTGVHSHQELIALIENYTEREAPDALDD